MRKAFVGPGHGPRAALLASPSNPTGTSIDPSEMRRIVEWVREQGGVTVVDEDLPRLSYDDAFGHSALATMVSVTGWHAWRWLGARGPGGPVERLAQNLFICASSVAQHAAMACFDPESIAEYERRRAEFRARRDRVVPALQALGLTVPVTPDGAFYVYADCGAPRPAAGISAST